LPLRRRDEPAVPPPAAPPTPTTRRRCGFGSGGNDMKSTRTRVRRGLAVLATATVLGGAVYALGPGAAAASSHREAPLVAADPAIDNTDLYAFVSPERPDYVTFIANWQPF